MAKHKATTQTPEKNMANPILFRTTEADSLKVRKHALNDGAVTVTTKTVGPNIVETKAVFDREKNVKAFLRNLPANFRQCLCTEEVCAD